MASNPTDGGFGPTTPIAPGPLPTSTGSVGLDPLPFASEPVRDTASDLGHKAQGAAEGVRDQALRLKDQALDQARSAASEGKEKAAETLSGVAQNVRDAARSLGQNETIAPVGKYANQAADAIEEFAGTLRNRDVDQLFNDISGFVRRNPAIAIGVAVAAGFAVSRLLKGGSDVSTASEFGGSTRYAGGYDDNAFKS